MKTCSLCPKTHLARNLCATHYQRWKRTGTTEGLGQGARTDVPDLATRFRRSYEKAPNGCWIWKLGVNKYGYGKIKVDGKTLGAHRVSFELAHGPGSISNELDHLCHTFDKNCVGGETCLHRRCVNPEHLEPVSTQENTARRDRRDRDDL